MIMKNSPFTVEPRKGRKMPPLHIVFHFQHVPRKKMGDYFGRTIGNNGEILAFTELEQKITSVMKNFRAQAKAFGVPAGTFLKYYMVHEDAIYTDKVATK